MDAILALSGQFYVQIYLWFIYGLSDPQILRVGRRLGPEIFDLSI